MAPRRQKKKSRFSRMDAALDAMTPYGFSGQSVRKAVRHLLKEYGGNEGWPFIEDCAYKELIDTLLRDSEGGAVTWKIKFRPSLRKRGAMLLETLVPFRKRKRKIYPEVAVSTQGFGNEGATSSARPPTPPPKGVKTRSIRACYGWIKD